MTNARSSEETAVIATYSSRRDAEVARDYLDDVGIEAFVTADDAGGMHPELQRTQGVKLTVMDTSVREATGKLEEAGLLPAPVDEGPPPDGPEDVEAGDLFFSTEGPLFTVAFVVLIVCIVLSLLIVAGL